MEPSGLILNAMMVFLTLFLATFIFFLLLIIHDGLEDWKRKRAARKIKPKTPAPRNNHE